MEHGDKAGKARKARKGRSFRIADCEFGKAEGMEVKQERV
jgi:hypothetical protein